MIKENIEAGLEWQNLSYRYTDWSNQTLGPKKKKKTTIHEIKSEHSINSP